MDKLKEAIKLIGRDIGNIEGQQASLLSQSKAYELFPTYSTLQAQMTTNIKEKHLELGLDALIDTKLQNGGDPFITKSKLPVVDTSQLVNKNEFEELKRKISANNSGSSSTELKGQGFPYALNADIGTIYTDTTAKNGAVKWIKKANGTGAGAWSVLFGDVKFRPKNISSNMLSLDALIQRLKLVLVAFLGVGLVS